MEENVDLANRRQVEAPPVPESTVFMLDGEVGEHASTNDIFTNPSDERTERYVTGKFG